MYIYFDLVIGISLLLSSFHYIKFTLFHPYFITINLSLPVVSSKLI